MLSPARAPIAPASTAVPQALPLAQEQGVPLLPSQQPQTPPAVSCPCVPPSAAAITPSCVERLRHLWGTAPSLLGAKLPETSSSSSQERAKGPTTSTCVFRQWPQPAAPDRAVGLSRGWQQQGRGAAKGLALLAPSTGATISPSHPVPAPAALPAPFCCRINELFLINPCLNYQPRQGPADLGASHSVSLTAVSTGPGRSLPCTPQSAAAPLPLLAEASAVSPVPKDSQRDSPHAQPHGSELGEKEQTAHLICATDGEDVTGNRDTGQASSGLAASVLGKEQ